MSMTRSYRPLPPGDDAPGSPVDSLLQDHRVFWWVPGTEGVTLYPPGLFQVDTVSITTTENHVAERTGSSPKVTDSEWKVGYLYILSFIFRDSFQFLPSLFIS